jgi:hypothetical protein
MNITALQNAMDAIEQDPENFFECSKEKPKAAMGEMV